LKSAAASFGLWQQIFFVFKNNAKLNCVSGRNGFSNELIIRKDVCELIHGGIKMLIPLYIFAKTRCRRWRWNLVRILTDFFHGSSRLFALILAGCKTLNPVKSFSIKGFSYFKNS